MDIDLKNINMSDIKDQITKLADKKTLIKIGIIFGAIVFFLIIYYAILNPLAFLLLSYCANNSKPL
jgi:hypothetical protein